MGTPQSSEVKKDENGRTGTANNSGSSRNSIDTHLPLEIPGSPSISMKTQLPSVIQGTPGNSMNTHLPSGETILTACIQDKNVKCLKSLLKQNLDMNQTNRYGDTPLLLALRTNHTELIELLLQQQTIDVNQPGRFLVIPLQIAVISGSIKLVKLLLDHGADPNGICSSKNCHNQFSNNSSKPLQLAIEDERMAKLLIKKGASVNTGCPLYTAIKKKSVKVALEILDNENLDVDLLNQHKYDLLAAAARVHSCELVKKLIEKGVVIRTYDTNKPVEEYRKYDCEVGPLGCVIHYGCWTCFEYLLNYVTDMDLKDLEQLSMLTYAMIKTGWECDLVNSRSFERNSVVDCDQHHKCVNGNFSSPTASYFRLNSFRLKYAKELLNRGADLSAVWDRSVCSTMHFSSTTDHITQRQHYKHEIDALHFCIGAYHCVNELKCQSTFRQISSTYDMNSLALVYSDGYDPTEQDVVVVENIMKSNVNRIVNSNSDTPFSIGTLGMLRKMPRTLKNIAVVKIRKTAGPNVYKAVKELPLPETLKETVLLEDSRGMVPQISNLQD